MPEAASPSTGVAEQVVQVGVRQSYSLALSVQDSIWFKLLYDDEAIQLITLATHNANTQPQLPTSVTEKNLSAVSPSAILPTEQEKVSDSMFPNVSVTPLQGYIAPKKVFESAIDEDRLEKLSLIFENSWSLYLTDTGGQMEFQEILPVLVSGPLLFFITFRLDQDLSKHFTIEYHLPDGRRSQPYQSTLTVMETILQTLASIASMGTFSYEGPQMENCLLKPKVFIVATHKDLLDPVTANSDIKTIDSFIQSVIKNTAHYQQDLVEFASDSQLIFTVNNFSSDDSDFQVIRSAVERVVSRSDFEVTFPSNWLIFSHVLRQKTIKTSVISYDQCFMIAKDCGIMDHEELSHALWFLHTKVGLIRHFPTPALKDVVIRYPQILFDMITNLIVNTFTFENVSKRCSSEFQQKGIFILEDFIRVQQKSTSLLPPVKLLQLLKHLRIIAPFKDDRQEKYFFPCVLSHSKELDSQSSSQSSDIPPLLVTFKCGYCPKGLPGALIVYLLTNEMQSNYKWELMTNQIFRDQVSFEVSPFDSITLKIHPTHLEIVHSYTMTRNSSKITQTVEVVCDGVRASVEKGIKVISSDINLTEKAAHSLSFLCRNPECSTSLEVAHPATEITKDESDSLCNLLCNKSGKRLRSPLPKGCGVWFGEVKEPSKNETALAQFNEKLKIDPHWQNTSSKLKFTLTDSNSTSTSLQECLSPDSARIQVVSQCPQLSEAFKVLLPVASEWEDIAVLLSIPHDRVMAIRQENMLRVNSCLRAILVEWLNQTNPRPSWNTLAEVMELLSNPAKAQEIRENYIASTIS